MDRLDMDLTASQQPLEWRFESCSKLYIIISITINSNRDTDKLALCLFFYTLFVIVHWRS